MDQRGRRLAPLAALVVPVVVIAAFVAVDAVRGERDPVSLSAGSGSGEQPRATSPGPGPTPTRPACPEAGLSVSPGGQDAAMGLRVLQIVVVNCGKVARTLHGYPAVRVLDEDRRPIEVTVGNGSSGISSVPSFDAKPVTVTLQPGQRATSAVLWRNLVTDPSVPATVGPYLRVSVTGDDPAQEIDAAGGGIDLGNTRKLGVAPWAAYG